MIYEITDLQKIGQGCSKIVFQHPVDANKVIKIMNPERVGSDGGWEGHGKIKRQLSQGVYKQLRRELLQYLQLCKNQYKHNQFVFPVETPYGFAQTSHGLGLITEKIISPNDQGMTLFELCKTKQFEEKHTQALDEFFKACLLFLGKSISPALCIPKLVIINPNLSWLMGWEKSFLFPSEPCSSPSIPATSIKLKIKFVNK